MKKIFAVAVATVMTLAMTASAFAAETVKGVGWWNAENTKSTAVALADGETVTFKVDVAEATETETLADGAADTYAAFCVEANDGALYFTSTSAGDAWGMGDGSTIEKETGVADAKKGGSYTVTVTREGQKISATYVDNATGQNMFKTLAVTAADATTLGEFTVYVMGQVGTLTVEQVVANDTPADDTPAGDTPAGDTPADTTPKTGDMTAVLPVALLAVAAMAVVVVMRKRTVTE